MLAPMLILRHQTERHGIVVVVVVGVYLRVERGTPE